MSKKRREVKKKEDENLGRAGAEKEGTYGRGSITLGLSHDNFRLTVPKEKTRARILFGEHREAFASGCEIARTFYAKISSIRILDQDVIAKFPGAGIHCTHNNYSPAG
jgi:hypothetical protein